MASSAAVELGAMALDAALMVPVFSLLRALKTKYDGVKEGRELCERLHQRLEIFASELDNMSPEAMRAETLLPQLKTLIQEYTTTVTVFADRNFVKRIIRLDDFKQSVKVYNERLDGLISMISVKHTDRLVELLQWRDQYQQDAARVWEQLAEMQGLQREIWKALNQLKQTNEIEEVRLVAMRDVSNDEDDEQDAQSSDHAMDPVLRHIITIAEGNFLTGKKLSSPPAWLIAADEFTVCGKPIDTENQSSIYVAKWQGALVAVKQFGVIDETRVYEKHFALWRTLLHPNVAQLYGTGSNKGAPFFVYEYASRQSLDRCWSQLTQKEIFALLHQAALGLAYLHQKRVVHGNLSCAKVLVTESGTAKVYGFGASYMRVGDASNSIKADVREEFAAPECVGIGVNGSFHGQRHSPRLESDVYSFGLTILEAMVKDDPFGGKNSRAVRACKQKEELDRPDGVSDQVWALVTQMCQRDPNQRVSLAYVIEQLAEFASATQ